jgi:hypothetical protein
MGRELLFQKAYSASSLWPEAICKQHSVLLRADELRLIRMRVSVRGVCGADVGLSIDLGNVAMRPAASVR